MDIASPITAVKGIGEKTQKAFAKMGVYTVGDILLHFPRDYVKFPEITDIDELNNVNVSSTYAIHAVIKKAPVVKNTARMQITLQDIGSPGHMIQLVWYRMPYLKAQLVQGRHLIFYGHIKPKGGRYVMEQPVVYEVQKYEAIRDTLQPVYSVTSGVTNNLIVKTIKETLSHDTLLSDYLPKDIRHRYGFCEYNYAMKQIHFPDDFDALVEARRRLVFDEFFLFIMGMRYQNKKQQKDKNEFEFTDDAFIDGLIDKLPYELTGAQKRCVSEIISDMSGQSLMNRILTGDVGSGKTIVAAAVCYCAVKNGYRAAVMVPTEILAEQHAEDFQKLFSPLGINCALLTGSTRKKARDMILSGLADENELNRVDIVIGTQALISEDVKIYRLGLAVIDEQHRFGVAQRAALFEKAEDVHCLVMSATPIPRTMTLATYGSIAVSRIDELPRGRQKVDTFIVNESYRARLNAFIKKQADEGHQTYVVCPAVEEAEKEQDSENIGDIMLIDDTETEEKLPMKAAETMAEYLTSALPELKVGLIHGKMKTAARDVVMREFENGEVNVLVSTTVIEVGVNVPNASLMIVENAERFGLSQLHQLRGRVGRGNIKSYFILVSDAKDLAARERLGAIKSTTDGFKIAEYDLEQRGPGDFFSDSGIIRQSGEIDLRLAASCTDTDMIEKAAYYAKKITADDPALTSEKNKALRRQLTRFNKKTSKTNN